MPGGARVVHAGCGQGVRCLFFGLEAVASLLISRDEDDVGAWVGLVGQDDGSCLSAAADNGWIRKRAYLPGVGLGLLHV